MEDETYTFGGEVDVVALFHLEPANENRLPPVELTDEQRRAAFDLWMHSNSLDKGLGLCPDNS